MACELAGAHVVPGVAWGQALAGCSTPQPVTQHIQVGEGTFCSLDALSKVEPLADSSSDGVWVACSTW